MQGISVELQDLINLQRFVRKTQQLPKRCSARVGAWQSTTRGRGMDFTEVRNYQAGDEVRHMEWRVTARTGKPYVKLFQEERERPIVLLVDFNPSMFFGTRECFKSVTAARLSSLLAWTAANEGDRLGGLIVSPNDHQEHLPRAREHGVLPFLSALSEFSKQIPTDFNHTEPLSAILMRSRRVLRPGSTFVIISDGYNLDEACTQHLRRICQHNMVLMYHICDPLELTPPPPAKYTISDGHKELLVDTQKERMQSAWQEDCQRRAEAVDALCKQWMIQKTTVTGLDNLPLLVSQTFPRRRYGAA